MSLTIFAFLGTYNLIVNYIKEVRNKDIKEKADYVMLGVAISLVTFFPLGIKRLLIMILLLVLSIGILSYIKEFSKENILSLTWIITGFLIMNIEVLILFTVVLVLLMCIVEIALRVFKYDKRITKRKRYDIILISFVITCTVYRLF